MAFYDIGPPPFERQDDGKFAVNLEEDERELLAEMCDEHLAVIKDHDDGSTMRLYPPAYRDDLTHQLDYERLMRGDLENSHIAAIEMVKETLNAEVLTEEQLHAWSRALNQVRLVLGTRLNVTEDREPDLASLDDATRAAAAFYGYLSELTQAAIEALSETLD